MSDRQITTFKVNRYECHSCAMLMEGICEDTPGVHKAEVHATSKTLTVEHDASTDLQKLQSELAAEGYPVSPVTKSPA